MDVVGSVELSSLTVFHNDVEVRLAIIDFVDLYDIWML